MAAGGRRACYSRHVAIEVIGAGFGRTGTTSLKAALRRLGYDKCHHMDELLTEHKQARTWIAAQRGEPVDWRALLRGYRATTDWPSCSFYRELMREFPEAKVVLTVRDPDRWYDSVAATIYPLSYRQPRWIGALARGIGSIAAVAKHVVWDGTFSDRFSDRAHAIAVFKAHIEEVKRVVPAERLLVFEVKQGWEPLCAFLGVPAPDEPFPHLNERLKLRRIARVIKILSIAGPVALALVVALLLLALRSRLGV